MIYNATMINLRSAKYTELYGTHECECGHSHNFNVKCVLQKGALSHISEFIASFTPELSRVVIFYDEESESIALKCEDGLKRSFRTAKFKAGSDKELDGLVLPEDARLILGIGGAIEAAKYKSALCDIPLVVSGALSHISFMPICAVESDKSVRLIRSNPPVGYIFDPELDFDKAAVFGSVAACLNTAFEYYAAMALSDKQYCPQLGSALSDIAASTILAASECDKGSQPLRELLLTSSLKISLIASKLPLFGEVQCALVGKKLAPKYSLGTLEFIYAAVLSSLYKSHVMYRRSFVPPPDNNYRLGQISELFGISEFVAVKTVLRQMSAAECELVCYKIKEYSGELIEKLGKNINLYRLAFRTFKRLMPDGGYSLYDLVNDDIPLCLALAPDLVSGEGMLTQLKRLGELDRYID